MMLKYPVVALSLVGGVAVADPDVPQLNPPNGITSSPTPVFTTPAPPTPTPPTDVNPPDTPVPTVMTSDTNVLVLRDRPGPYSYAWNDPYLQSGIGVGFSIGGGLTGFTDRAMRDTVSSNVGGLWDARASFGTHTPLGLDVGYIGSAANINTINGSANGTLVGTTVEAAIRYNILPHNMINPYIFAGAGWQRYDVQNIHFAQSDTGMAPKDNVAEFPMGAGLGVRDVSGFNFDVRGTFRATTDSTLLQEANGSYAQLHSWEASGSVGYEF